MPNTISVKDALNQPVTLDTQGTAISGQGLESGGYSVLGWLSSLRKTITDRLPAVLGGSGGMKVEVVLGAQEPASSSLFAGITSGITTSPIALTSNQPCREVLVHADSANGADLRVGTAATQSIPLGAGDAITLRVTNVNLVFASSASGTVTANWLARS